MTYQEALREISSFLRFGVRPGLERISRLLSLLGNPQNTLRFVHVAGTNGKGSTCAMTASVLTKAGYRTGLYLSPYILDFRERMQIDGEMIPKEDLARLVEKVLPLVRKMERDGEIITEFEFITALAFCWFSERGCDAVVLEVGLGGRFDATNVIGTPLVSVLAAISLDHMKILGDTVDKIAFEKCGIIKENGTTVVFADQKPEAMEVIRRTAKERSNRLLIADPAMFTGVSSNLHGTDFTYEDTRIHMSLIGGHQVKNAAAAVTALEVLREKGFSLPAEKIREGFASVRFPARLELLCGSPVVLLDGAHNPNGTAALAAAIRQYLPGRKIVAVMGMLADKDVRSAIRELDGLFSQVVTLTPDNPRAMDAETLAGLWRGLSVRAGAAKTDEAALERALSCAGPDGAVVICGSLYLAARLRPAALKILQNKGLSANFE
ncbi:MAG TPA: bifunctional folylpolyglutamate synthase/dihydrofolate synthase [Ruminococcaceae bacterium]|jgi:dihydrofolate synthase/folylpolyglutamate synthase|nr:bifunctional folylpolyglutamate synthase/dihydrofolate synthase [Oscillospiraceae bacterium]